jgi:hypothetical protein
LKIHAACVSYFNLRSDASRVDNFGKDIVVLLGRHGRIEAYVEECASLPHVVQDSFNHQQSFKTSRLRLTLT